MLATEADSVRREFRNTTIKGSGYERKLIDAVVGLLPQTWRVGSGEVVDPSGRRSGQTDLVIALPNQPSLLHSDNGDWIFLSGRLSSPSAKRSYPSTLKASETSSRGVVLRGVRLTAVSLE